MARTGALAYGRAVLAAIEIVRAQGSHQILQCQHGFGVRQIPGQGDATKAGLPTFKFGTSKSRTDYSGQGKLPGPGEYGTPNMSSSSSKARDTKRSYHAPPKYTMYESYSWRTKGKKAAPAKKKNKIRSDAAGEEGEGGNLPLNLDSLIIDSSNTAIDS